MSARTKTRTEYAPMGLTKEGRWRPITSSRCSTPEAAGVALEGYKAIMEKLYKGKGGPKAYKVMKRTVTITMTEWEDLAEIDI